MAKSRRQVRGFVVLHASFHKEDDQWVGTCEELGTSTFADTLEEAHEELKELVHLHLNTLEQVGERSRFFKQHGVRLYKPDDVPTEVRANIPVLRKHQPEQLGPLAFAVSVPA